MNYFNNRTPMRVRGILDLSKPKAQGNNRLPGFPQFPGFPTQGKSGPTVPTSSPAPQPPAGPTKPASTLDLLGGGAPNTSTSQAPAVRGTFGGMGTNNPPQLPTPGPTVRPPISSGFQTFQQAGQAAAAGPMVGTPAPTPKEGPLEPPKEAPVVRGTLAGPQNVDIATPSPFPQRAVNAQAGVTPAALPNQDVATAPAMPKEKLIHAKTGAAIDPTKPAPQPTPEQDLATVRDFFQQLMTTQDDPVLKKQWNQLLISRGLENQAAMDALKMRINQDPALAGQPAGDTMLMEFVRDSGFSLDQARAQLTVEAANRIRDLNQYGAENFLKLAQYRQTRGDAERKELLAADDLDGYAKAFKASTGLDVDVSKLKELSPATTQAVDSLSKAMVRNIESGNMEAARRNFESIKALAPSLYGALTFEDAVSGKDAYLLQSEARQAVGAMVRTQVSQGNLQGALAGIEQLMPNLADRQKAGGQMVQATDLTQINDALRAAGMSEVLDKADLIGREEDVWKAMELAKLQQASGKTVVDDTVSMLQGELQKLGFNPTDPEAARALRSYALNLQLTGGLKIGTDGKVSLDANSVIPPWDPKSLDSHLFTDWPILGADGKTSSGWDPYGKDNPRPAEDTALGRYYNDLDGKWEDYILKTPAASRLTREQWFYATTAGTTAPDPTKVPGGPAGDTGDPDTDTIAIEEVMEKVRTGKQLEAKDLESLRASSQFQTTLGGLPFGSNFQAWSKANPDRVAVIDGKVFRVDQGGSFKNGNKRVAGLYDRENSDDYVQLTDMETGKVYYYSDATDVTEADRWFAEKPTSRTSKKVLSPFSSNLPGTEASRTIDGKPVTKRVGVNFT